MPRKTKQDTIDDLLSQLGDAQRSIFKLKRKLTSVESSVRSAEFAQHAAEAKEKILRETSLYNSVRAKVSESISDNQALEIIQLKRKLIVALMEKNPELNNSDPQIKELIK